MRIAVVALLTLAIAAGCGSSDERSAQPTTDTQPPPAATAREPAPPLSGETLDAETIALADFRGRPVLINVWSSW